MKTKLEDLNIRSVLRRMDDNNEIVCYCKDCLSLRIIGNNEIDISEDIAFCDDCSSTNIGEVPCNEWERMYKEKYNKPLIIE